MFMLNFVTITNIVFLTYSVHMCDQPNLFDGPKTVLYSLYISLLVRLDDYSNYGKQDNENISLHKT